MDAILARRVTPNWPVVFWLDQGKRWTHTNDTKLVILHIRSLLLQEIVLLNQFKVIHELMILVTVAALDEYSAFC